MPDILIAGNTYASVPSIVVPKSGGGNAEFYDLDADLAWMGKDVTLLNGNFYSASGKLSSTTFNGWTPSTTAKSIITSKTADTFAADMTFYEYYIVWECGVDPVYTGSPSTTARPLISRAWMLQNIVKRPSSYSNVFSNTFNGNASANLYSGTWMQYYGSTAGTITMTWSASYGFYFGLTAATFSNSTSDTPTVTVKTPTLNARCSTTYLSTGNAALIDQDKSTYFIRCKLYRVKPNSIYHNIYRKTCDFINA